MRTLGAIAFVLMAACGGGKAAEPAAEPAAPEPAADTSCCCDFVLETGGGDTGEIEAENQTYERMSADECAGQSGSCVDASSCDAPAE